MERNNQQYQIISFNNKKKTFFLIFGTDYSYSFQFLSPKILSLLFSRLSILPQLEKSYLCTPSLHEYSVKVAEISKFRSTHILPPEFWNLSVFRISLILNALQNQCRPPLPFSLFWVAIQPLLGINSASIALQSSLYCTLRQAELRVVFPRLSPQCPLRCPDGACIASSCPSCGPSGEPLPVSRRSGTQISFVLIIEKPTCINIYVSRGSNYYCSSIYKK